MKTSTETPDPDDADKLAKREAEAQAAMDAALKQDMDPKIEAERNLRTSTASLRLELSNALGKLLAAADKIAPAFLRLLVDYLNKLAIEIYANNAVNRGETVKSIDEAKAEVVAEIHSATNRVFRRLVVVELFIGGLIVLVVHFWR